MATRAQNRPLRRGAMHDEGALYDALYNLVELVNAATGASMTLEGGSAPSATLAATATEIRTDRIGDTLPTDDPNTRIEN